ncbi:helix-turn-helix domain-containing protein [Palleronia rufa]|uniref:helix-turn-helix domain-containing protein n=1 Tax=Palleronia rufa TaxID=1530186 RepID=UPI000569E7ED|nr:helix-turn-helix domain-containing protein [Palleronia rufa]
MPKRFTFKTKQDILRLVAEGRKDAEVADIVGCSRPTVSRLRRRGISTDRTTRGRVLQVRVSQREADAFDAVLDAEDMSASEMLRRLMRLSAGLADFRREEIDALRQSSNQMNALARNLVQMLQLARAGRLRWNRRDGELVVRLLDRVEDVARDLQVVKAAGARGAVRRVEDVREGADA